MRADIIPGAVLPDSERRRSNNHEHETRSRGARRFRCRLLVSSLFSVLQATDPCNAVALENSFFDIVDVEEELHFAWWMAELRDIGFKVFLDLRREIA
jgi:hypothetical protein